LMQWGGQVATGGGRAGNCEDFEALCKIVTR
jgi:hypothetical protein